MNEKIVEEVRKAERSKRRVYDRIMETKRAREDPELVLRVERIIASRRDPITAYQIGIALGEPLGRRTIIAESVIKALRDSGSVRVTDHHSGLPAYLFC